jgi:peptidoglycan-associated lipoprotein
VLSAAIALFAAAPATRAQQAPPAVQVEPRAELAFDYSYLHSNAPPGGCGCFNLNGGSVTFSWYLKPSFALVGDFGTAHAGSITPAGYDLTVSTYTAGLRYRMRLGHSPLHSYGQVLVGVGHSSGALVQGESPAVSNAGAAFAAKTGGGLDLKVSHRIALRLLEADYLVTTFDNGSNNHQNNLRLSAGLVFNLGK